MIKPVAVTFGAAMAAAMVAPELHADIQDLTFNPGSLPFSAGASTNVLMQTSGGTIGTFSQWNDGIGKTLNFNTGGLLSWTIVQYSQTLNAATFGGVAGNIGFTTAASGTVYVGFRSVAGNVGWFAMDLGGAGVYGLGDPPHLVRVREIIGVDAQFIRAGGDECGIVTPVGFRAHRQRRQRLGFLGCSSADVGAQEIRPPRRRGESAAET